MTSRDLPIETFLKILRCGFYYKKDGEIYSEFGAVFVGNGIQDCMVKTHSSRVPDFAMGAGIGNKGKHYWDWENKEDIWDFNDYGVTWSVNKEDLL